MKKGLIAGIIILSGLFVGVQAQDSSINLKPIKNFVSGTSMVKKALYKAFRVVRQDYHLIDKKGGWFGRGNKPYFGRHYGIGIVAGNVLWTEKQVIYPWMIDKSYQVLAGDTLTPTQGKTSLAYYNYSYNDCNCNYKLAKEIKYDSVANRALGYYKLPKKNPSIQFHKKEIPQTGIMVIFYSKGTQALSDNTHIKMSITKQYVNWNDARSKGKIRHIKLPGKILGGAFFSENYDLAGVSFKLVAMYTRNITKPEKWELTAFQNDFTSKLTVIKPEGDKKPKRRRRRRGRNRNN